MSDVAGFTFGNGLTRSQGFSIAVGGGEQCHRSVALEGQEQGAACQLVHRSQIV